MRRTLGSLALTCLLVGAAGAEQTTSKKHASAATQQPSIDEMMKAMAKYSEPTEKHKKLEALVGSWTTTGKFWMDPEKPMESTGTAETKSILGGRFISEDVTGTFMGRPFMGHGVTGYDLMKKKYVSVWMDNMGTMMMVSEGTSDPAGKVITSTSTETDPMTGKSHPVKLVTRIESDQKHVLEFYEKRNGKEMKTGEMIYTRK